MTAKPKSAPRHSADSDQHRRFVETARQLGVDEDEDRFRDKLRVIARQKPKDEPKPKK